MGISPCVVAGGIPAVLQQSEGRSALGCHGNEYVDYVSAYGPNLFGYGFEPVDRAAAIQQALGDTLTGPSEVMVELAEAFVGMVSHAEWVMFCKNGSDATTMALVVARAHTARRTVLVARHAYHGSAPWCTPRSLRNIPGGPRAHRQLQLQRC